jgi:hypothetical protein
VDNLLRKLGNERALAEPEPIIMLTASLYRQFASIFQSARRLIAAYQAGRAIITAVAYTCVSFLMALCRTLKKTLP